MFLGKLNDEKKNLFLELCLHAAKANKIITVEEETVLKEYAAEMALSDYPTELGTSLEALLESIKSQCTAEEIRVFTFEIMALMLSDHYHDMEERSFMETLKEKLGIGAEKVVKAEYLIRKLTEVYEEIGDFISASE